MGRLTEAGVRKLLVSRIHSVMLRIFQSKCDREQTRREWLMFSHGQGFSEKEERRRRGLLRLPMTYKDVLAAISTVLNLWES